MQLWRNEWDKWNVGCYHGSMFSRFKIPLGWGELLKRTFKEGLDDNVFDLAAQQAYYFFFALFPALLALISIAAGDDWQD